jgi:iron(III) transport system substrate-binding protein
MNRFRVAGLLVALTPSVVFAAGAGEEATGMQAGDVNVYSHRHYAADDQLYERFEELTGVTVNLVQGDADELIARLQREGAASPADVLFTVDAGRLVRAKDLGLLQAVNSPQLEADIPQQLRDAEGFWYGLTSRARVIAYHKGRVNPAQLSTYEALTDPIWEGRVLVRSSSNIYNQSLLASMIATQGPHAARRWAAGVVANMARPPSGGDTDQLKGLAAGDGDVALVNTYYVGRLQASAEASDREVGEVIGVYFPNQGDRGTHTNVSGAGVTAAAKNLENAVRLLEFLASAEAQRIYATANDEYPVNPAAEIAATVAAWGEFKADALPLQLLGERNAEAVRIFDEVGWR